MNRVNIVQAIRDDLMGTDTIVVETPRLRLLQWLFKYGTTRKARRQGQQTQRVANQCASRTIIINPSISALGE